MGKKRVFVLYGQFGRALSGGIHDLGLRIAERGHDVSFWRGNDVYAIERAINQPTILIGYSMGGSYASWVPNDLPSITFPLVVSYDPTINVPTKPLGPNVLRAVCFRQTGFLVTSMFFGRNYLTSRKGGPAVEEYRRATDHLLMQYQEEFHQITLKAIEDAS